MSAYERGWVELTLALEAGSSWSGRERNVAYVNLGNGRFADISAVSGLDFLDDGRCVVSTDWDHDGALDLWLRNRTGPQLRLLRGQREAGDRWLTLELVGTSCNRDAVGARVVLHTSQPDGSASQVAREVTAGDGYLSQSSLRLHFALGPDEAVREVSVRWPGGAVERIEGVTAGRAHRIVQGAGEAEPISRPRHALAAAEPHEAGPPPGRVVLRTPFPLPPTTRRTLAGDGSSGAAVLLNLWSIDCAPCLTELVDLAAHHAELEEHDLTLVPICVDTDDAAERAQRFYQERIVSVATGRGPQARSMDPATIAVIEAVLGHCLGKRDAGLLPTSLLVDRAGWLQVIYIGPVTAEALARDAAIYASGPRGAVARAGWPGRWFFGMPRDLAALAKGLSERGLRHEARFYELLGGRTPR